MEPEATMICIDNTEWMRNGDYSTTRFQAQNEAVQLIVEAKIQSHTDNTVGVVCLAGRSGPRVLIGPNTRDLREILNCFHGLNLEMASAVNLTGGIKTAMLALKNRKNQNQQQRIIVFAGSPIEDDRVKMEMIGETLNQNSVALDIVDFGEFDYGKPDKLEALFSAINNNGNNSNIIHVIPGQDALYNALTSSAITGGLGEGDSGLDALRAYLEEEGQNPVAAQEPEEGQDPVAAQEPEEGQDPVAAQEPEEGQDPVAAQEPEEGQDPVAAQEPEEGQDPVAAQEPEEGQDPIAAQEPEEGQDPVAAQEPAAQPPRDDMVINVKNMEVVNAEIIELKVNGADTAGTLMMMLYDRTGIQPNLQQIICKSTGVALYDDRLILGDVLENNCTVKLYQTESVPVLHWETGNRFTIKGLDTKFHKVSDLKSLIEEHEEYGVPVDEQVLVIEETDTWLLEESRYLVDYNICSGVEICVYPPADLLTVYFESFMGVKTLNDVPLYCKVYDVKAKIRDHVMEVDSHDSRLHLFFNDTELQDNRGLWRYGITSGCTLRLHLDMHTS